MLFALPIVLPVAALAAVTKFHLMGKNMSKYDTGAPVTFDVDKDSKGVKAVEEYLYENFVKPAMMASSTGDKLDAKRARFEEKGLSRDFPVTFKQDTVQMDGLSVDGEWTIAPGSDPRRRLLYLHGGAFTVGSAISHRAIISNIAGRTGCVVFAPNYRLMPENPRMASIEDARASYKWILENGPDGPAPLDKLAVAGDSAGGNLTLMLSNWVRDAGLRAADAVVALSPSTDSTASSPSIKSNFETDTMLKPLIGPLLKIPRPVLLWGSWRANKISPASKLVSPLRDNLSNLPPTLVQVSAAEMLYDDARRYAAKAQSEGSDVTLQSWAHVCHVWQAFDLLIPEAMDAFDEIAKFLVQHGVGKKPKAAKKKTKARVKEA